MLQRAYDWTMNLAGHRHAYLALFAVAFAESSFFPVPPDVLIIPMILASRERAWKVALVATIASVVGGMAGYGIGAFLFEALGRPVLEFYHAMAKFESVRELYNENGALIVFTAGFSPIPYKIFTIASGVTGLNPVAFAVASLVGRGGRFFLVAWLLRKYGEPIRSFIEDNLAKLTLLFVLLLAGGFFLVKVFL